MTTCLPDYRHEDLVDCERAKPRPMSMIASVLRCIRSQHDIRLLDERTCEDLTLHARPSRAQVPSLAWLEQRVYQPSATRPADYPRCEPRP